MNLSRYIALLILLTNINQAQVYLGMIDKEGIFLSENIVYKKYSYDYVQDQLKRMTYDRDDNVIFDNYQKEFEIFSKINIGDKFYIACSENVTQETVSGYIIYDWEGIMKEFYPLIANKTNLCKSFGYDQNFVIISKEPVKNKIRFDPNINSDTKQLFKQRILDDVKNFEIQGSYNETLGQYDRDFIQAVYDEDLIVFKGSFCNKYKEEYFVSYTKRSEFTKFVNANYVMDPFGSVTEFFTTPRDVFDYSTIFAICDYDNDGLDEILISNNYYEGGGIELWKYMNNKFIKVADGFYFGV